MVQSPAQTLTLAEFLELPETKPATEYIDGQFISKPIPQGKHSAIQGELGTAINHVVKPSGIARAFPELRCTFGNRSIVPDLAIFTWDRIPRDENREIANMVFLAPDWVIEILSPLQSQTKVTKNILHCLKYGTQMGWLIDPDEQAVFIYQPRDATTLVDELDTRLSTPPFARGLQLSLRDLMAWLI